VTRARHPILSALLRGWIAASLLAVLALVLSQGEDPRIPATAVTVRDAPQALTFDRAMPAIETLRPVTEVVRPVAERDDDPATATRSAPTNSRDGAAQPAPIALPTRRPTPSAIPPPARGPPVA
jgi:hypothetical protein